MAGRAGRTGIDTKGESVSNIQCFQLLDGYLLWFIPYILEGVYGPKCYYSSLSMPFILSIDDINCRDCIY